MKRNILLFVLSIMITPAFAQNYIAGGYEHYWNNLNYYLFHRDDIQTPLEAEVRPSRENQWPYVGMITVPLFIDDVSSSVRGIGYGAFRNTAVTGVTLPDNSWFRYIGQYAFENCTGLTSMTIPSHVNELCGGAFQGCTNLKTVTFTPQVIVKNKYFLQYCFRDCTSLRSIDLSNVNVTEINNNAFANCTSLEYVTLSPGDSINGLGTDYLSWEVFNNCTRLRTITIDRTVPARVNDRAFDGLNVANVTLCVPSKHIAAYKASNIWKNFGSIVAIPTSVTINQPLESLPVNATVMLSASVAPTGANTSQKVTWTSSDPTVATVTNEGIVTGKAMGTATITATSINGMKTDTRTVNVTLPQTISFQNFSQQKTYGDGTYTLSALTNSGLTGFTYKSLNENVATISGNTVTIRGAGQVVIRAIQAGNNFYRADSASQTLTVNKASLTITPSSGQTKVYGNTDPEYTCVASGWKYSDATKTGILTGSLARAPGNDVGEYNITQGNLGAGNNYTINFIPNVKFTITEAPLTVTPSAGVTKFYGDVDPQVPYVVTGWRHSDAAKTGILTGSLGRVPGDTVGEYNITQGNLAARNYTINFIPNNDDVKFTINKAPLTVTPNAGQTKLYGDADPVFTYAVTGWKYFDAIKTGILTGSLDRVPGDTVGVYNITQGTLGAGNYTINLIPDVKFTIGKASLTIKPVGLTKVYGDVDPEVFPYVATGWKNSDSSNATKILTGSLDRAEGENVGEYNITQGNLSTVSNSNYTINYFSPDVKFTIEKAPLTVTPNAGQKKAYGDPDPEFTYVVSKWKYSDYANAANILTGSLGRVAGNDAGEYNIEQGNLSTKSNSNYTINFVPNVKFTIDKVPLTITPRELTKVYGDGDPALTYTATGWKYSDFTNATSILTGLPTREEGEDVGIYNITQGNLSTKLTNYTINFIPGVKFTIEKAPLTIKPTAGQKKVYGDNDPEFTYDATGWKFSDNAEILTGSLTRVEGENAGEYNILQGNVGAGNNYRINFIPNVKFTIEKALLTIEPRDLTMVYAAADPALTYVSSNGSLTKVYGDVDPPAFTYIATGWKSSDDVANATSILTGSLTRAAGENAGEYNITQGNIKAGSNYKIDFVRGAKFVINKGSQSITDIPDEIPNTVFRDETTFTLPKFANSGLLVTYTSSDPKVAIIEGSNTVRIVGTCPRVTSGKGVTPVTITASQDGGVNYNSADPVERSFIVWIKGDANGSGSVTALDINVIVNHLLGNIPTPELGSATQSFVSEAADANGSGRISALDINSIVNSLLGRQ